MTPAPSFTLDDRALLRVTGEEAEAFLQNLVTNDIRRVAGEGIVYACLLGPQGRLLHAFFVLSDGAGGYLLDCDAGEREALARRLGTYKLRSKVTIAAEEGPAVHATLTGTEGHADPRLPALGRRVYKAIPGAAPRAAYDDLCISLGVPPARAMKTDKDFLTDLNLDMLNAVSFTKGCFVGQELAARMENRALVKRRLLCVSGENPAPGDRIMQGDADMGEVRVTDTEAKNGLALLKLQRPETPASIPGKGAVRIHNPLYILKKS